MRITALCVGALATIALTGTPAHAAKPLDHGTYHDVWSINTVDDLEWPCAIDVQIDGDVHGNFGYGPRQPDGPEYGRETSHGTISYSANDSSYTEVFAVMNRDVTVTDNPDGTRSVVIMGTGSDKWFLNGDLMFQDSGQIRFELLITDPGTDQEQTQFVRIVRDSNGVNNTPTRTFCEDIEEWLAAPTP